MSRQWSDRRPSRARVSIRVELETAVAQQVGGRGRRWRGGGGGVPPTADHGREFARVVGWIDGDRRDVVTADNSADCSAERTVGSGGGRSNEQVALATVARVHRRAVHLDTTACTGSAGHCRRRRRRELRVIQVLVGAGVDVASVVRRRPGRREINGEATVVREGVASELVVIGDIGVEEDPARALFAKTLLRTVKSWPTMYIPYFALGSAAPLRATPIRLLAMVLPPV